MTLNTIIWVFADNIHPAGTLQTLDHYFYGVAVVGFIHLLNTCQASHLINFVRLWPVSPRMDLGSHKNHLVAVDGRFDSCSGFGAGHIKTHGGARKDHQAT